MKRSVILVALVLTPFLATGAVAQQRIDALVDRFSVVGHVTFTSTLDRDPATRRVKSIVRSLEVNNQPTLVDQMKKAFDADARSAQRADKQYKDGVLTQWLTFEDRSRNSVYRLQAHPGGRMKVTVVIKNK